MNELEILWQAGEYRSDKGYCGQAGSHGSAPCCDRCIPGFGQGHHYMKFYGMLFAGLRKEARTIVEIGVQHGGSILLWSDYFKDAGHIYGIDKYIRPEARQLLEKRIVTLIQADATDIDVLDKLPRDIDIIIDDGSHKLKDQCSALSLLWGLIRPGGWYCIEDIEPRDKDWLYDSMERLQPEIILTSDTTTRGGLWNSYVFAAQKGE